MVKKGQKVELVVLLQSAWFLKVSQRADCSASLTKARPAAHDMARAFAVAVPSNYCLAE